MSTQILFYFLFSRCVFLKNISYKTCLVVFICLRNEHKGPCEIQAYDGFCEQCQTSAYLQCLRLVSQEFGLFGGSNQGFGNTYKDDPEPTILLTSQNDLLIKKWEVR